MTVDPVDVHTVEALLSAAIIGAYEMIRRHRKIHHNGHRHKHLITTVK